MESIIHFSSFVGVLMNHNLYIGSQMMYIHTLLFRVPLIHKNNIFWIKMESLYKLCHL